MHDSFAISYTSFLSPRFGISDTTGSEVMMTISIDDWFIPFISSTARSISVWSLSWVWATVS